MPNSTPEPDRTLRRWKVLLDSPTAAPALGYRDIARAFASIIYESDPRFAVGIFGGWGAGKTTLMKAIKAALPVDGVIAVDFNAWRYEREPYLLIPLLDTIRAALVQSSEPITHKRDNLRSIAIRVGRVVRALAAGFSGEVGIPGALKVSYNTETVLGALSPPDEPENAQSLYVAAFQESEQAFGELSTGGVTRTVVFVDDLDRCLPANALDVLESMKLFFDLPGFVFVVGVDESVIERAICMKFMRSDEKTSKSAAAPGALTESTSNWLSRDYIKKLFQVPYTLPAMLPQQLDELLESMYHEAALSEEQLDDLRNRVRPYLSYIAVERRVNPRELKRFINAYTLQALVRPGLDLDTVLAPQTIASRHGWELVYDVVLSDSDGFIDSLIRFQEGEEFQSAFADLLPGMELPPSSLIGYLRSRHAEPLVRYSSLDAYLSSLESARSEQSWEIGAYRRIGQLRRRISSDLSQPSIDGDAISVISHLADGTVTEILYLLPGSIDVKSYPNLSNSLQKIRNEASELSRVLFDYPEGAEGLYRDSLTELQTAVDNAYQELRLIRDTGRLR